MTQRILHTLVSLSIIAGAVGCQPKEDLAAEEFRKGVPRAETVTADVPNKTGQALTVEQAGQSKISDFYLLTYGATSLFNGGAFFVAVLVKAVTAYPPTTIDETSAVWGPFDSDNALEPITWKVTITRLGALGDRHFSYKFEGRPKSNPSATFVTVLSGTHTASRDSDGNAIEGFGEGSFLLDWDARQMLPAAKDHEIGTAEYTYSRVDATADATINAQFRGVWDNDKKAAHDVEYAFVKFPGNGGAMSFSSPTPNSDVPNGIWSIHSRWNQTGAGRCDVRATSPDAGSPYTLSECWNTSFESSFLKPSWTTGYGVEATDCVFTSAEYSN